MKQMSVGKLEIDYKQYKNDKPSIHWPNETHT